MYMYNVGVELCIIRNVHTQPTHDTSWCIDITGITFNPTLHNACNRGNCCVHVSIEYS